METHYFDDFAAAFVRGRLGSAVADETSAEAIARGRAAGLRVHKFKRNAELPRVRKVIGVLRGWYPGSLVDVGSGRGTFLWPLLDALPATRVIAADVAERRAVDLAAVRRGGIERLSVVRMDARALALADDSVDAVTLLEVLEHMERPEAAAAEAVRVARGLVVVSVPSKEDDNPEHIHLFTGAHLERMLAGAGAARVSIDYVRGHIVAVATL